jgi:hypothetical protein
MMQIRSTNDLTNSFIMGINDLLFATTRAHNTFRNKNTFVNAINDKHIRFMFINNIVKIVSNRNIIHEPIVENIIYKMIIDNEKNICCITYEEISINERYMICKECKNNYKEQSLKQWLRQNISSKTCPTCRTNWTDYTIYINANNINSQV